MHAHTHIHAHMNIHTRTHKHRKGRRGEGGSTLEIADCKIPGGEGKWGRKEGGEETEGRRLREGEFEGGREGGRGGGE